MKAPHSFETSATISPVTVSQRTYIFNSTSVRTSDLTLHGKSFT